MYIATSTHNCWTGNFYYISDKCSHLTCNNFLIHYVAYDIKHCHYSRDWKLTEWTPGCLVNNWMSYDLWQPVTLPKATFAVMSCCLPHWRHVLLSPTLTSRLLPHWRHNTRHNAVQLLNFWVNLCSLYKMPAPQSHRPSTPLRLHTILYTVYSGVIFFVVLFTKYSTHSL